MTKQITMLEAKQLFEQLWEVLQNYEGHPKFKYEAYTIREGSVGIIVIETPMGSDCYNYYPGRKGFQMTHQMPFYNPKEQIKTTKNAINRLFKVEE